MFITKKRAARHSGDRAAGQPAIRCRSMWTKPATPNTPLTSSPKGSARSDGVPAATATKTVTVPADKMEALFASGKAKVVIASYFQPTAGVVGEAKT